MGLADEIAKVLHQQLKCHVAWLPISNTYALGDFGVISKGVFTKLGNISEFSVPFQTGTPQPARLDFVSADTTVRNFAGGVEVSVLPDDPAVEATVKIGFSKAGSFLMKAR